MNKLVNFIVTLIFLIGCQNALAAQIHEYKLSNCLQLLVKEDHRAPIVVSQVWHRVGSSYESYGKTGLSHVLEHMTFEGSKNYPGNSSSKTVSANGGNENAATSFDYTQYYQELSADRLPISFAINADRMRNLTLNQAPF